MITAEEARSISIRMLRYNEEIKEPANKRGIQKCI